MNLQPHCSASRGVTSAVSREKSTCSRKMRELADIEARRSYTICSPGPYVYLPRATGITRLPRAAPARLWAPQYVVTPQRLHESRESYAHEYSPPRNPDRGKLLGMSSENGSFTSAKPDRKQEPALPLALLSCKPSRWILSGGYPQPRG